MTKTITIPAEIAVSVASLATHTANPKNDAPVLGEIQVKITGTQLEAVATDRFSLAEFRATIPGQFETAPDLVHYFRLSLTAAKFITTNVKKLNKWRTPEPVTFTYDTDARSLTISYNGLTLEDSWVAAKYPAVENLLNQWEPATDNKPVKLNANFLGRMGKLLENFAKVEYWVMRTGTNGEWRPERPGPVLATAGNYRVLIQPNNYNPSDKI